MDLSSFWKTILDTMDDGVLIVDPSGTVLVMNPAAERLTGFSAGELVGKSCRELNCTGCRIIGKGVAEKWCGLYSKEGVQKKQCLITHKENRPVNVLKSAAILRDDTGKIIGAVEVLKDLSDLIRQQQEILALKKKHPSESGFHGLVGKSTAIQYLISLIQHVALSDAPVLITGESGTGKELVARAVHENSHRKSGPFIKVNCAALNENLLESELFGHVRGAYTGAVNDRVGRFEAANGGTIFLDEIGDLPLSTQIKLLRTLEEREIERVGSNQSIRVDVRIISATNRNLEQLIRENRFREDFYFRINVFPVQCPSLRDRIEDIPILVQHYIQINNERTGKQILGLTPEALECLMNYSWPGNVRELRNVIEYAFVLCASGGIGVQHLPPRMLKQGEAVDCPPPPFRQSIDKKTALLDALRRAGGNRTQAARILGISRVSVWKQIKKFHIESKRS
ncbi:MAG: sigma 54-interacting transcriptional regulator [Thermodesulfobacteriota bacterium]